MGSAFVYNDGATKKADDELNLTFGIFFDGTLNNKNGTDLRIKYRNQGQDPASGKEAKSVYTENEQNAIDKKLSDDSVNEESRYSKMMSGDYTPPSQEEADYLKAAHSGDFLNIMHPSRTEFSLDKMGVDNSFSNDYSNPARQWNCCNNPYRTYVEGIGTEDKKRDNDAGFQFGSGPTGIRGKVRKGCEKLADKILNEKGKKKITTITIDVFGFSRGAAAARHFVYQVNLSKAYTLLREKEYEVKRTTISVPIPLFPFLPLPTFDIHIPIPMPTIVETENIKKVDEVGNELAEEDLYDGQRPRMGFLGHALLKSGKLTQEEFDELTIIVRFVGIYETVSSYEEFGNDISKLTLAKHSSLGPEHYFGNDIKQLHLNTLRTKKIVHFTAMNEHRRNFSLTRLPKGIGIEKDFPGVHCDIGGAYETQTEKVDEIENTARGITPFGLMMTFLGLEKFKEKLVDEHWYKENQLEISHEWYYWKLSGTRFLQKEYSYIPLHFMVQYAKEHMGDNINSDITKVYPIDSDDTLVRAKARLEKYVINNGLGESGGKWIFINDSELQKRAKVSKEKEDEKKQQDLQQQRREAGVVMAKKRWWQSASSDATFVAKAPMPPTEHIDWVTLQEVIVLSDQAILRLIRNQYLHWSANKDWFGMEPVDTSLTGDRIRVEEQEPKPNKTEDGE